MNDEFENEITNSFDIVDFTESQEIENVSNSIDKKLEELNEASNNSNVNVNVLNVFSSDLDIADKNAVKAQDENPEFSHMVNNVVEKYNQHYGTNVEYGGLDEYLLGRANKSEKDKQIEDIVREEVAQEAINYLENKYLLVLTKYLDAQMTQMLRADISGDVSEISIALTDRLLAMRKELDKLKGKFKGGGDVGSKLDNVRGKNKTQFDEETMRLINLLKESTIKSYENTNKHSAPF